MSLQSMSVLENVDETGFLLTKIEGSTPHTLPGHMCSRSVAEVPLTYAASAVLYCAMQPYSRATLRSPRGFLAASMRSAREFSRVLPQLWRRKRRLGADLLECRSVYTAQVASSCGARVTEIAEQRTTPYCIYRQN
jgi:hypothetical protein|eukprot:COSAG06_NODE_13693_length_1230_cov_1.414677_1_plen_136_part_00